MSYEQKFGIKYNLDVVCFCLSVNASVLTS